MTSFLFIPFIPSILFDTSMSIKETPFIRIRQLSIFIGKERMERKEGMERKEDLVDSPAAGFSHRESCPAVMELVFATMLRAGQLCPGSRLKGEG